MHVTHPARRRSPMSEQVGEKPRRPLGPIGLHRAVRLRVARCLRFDRRRDCLRVTGDRVVEAGARRRTARGGAGRGSSARSGGAAGDRGTACGARSAPCRSSVRPGPPRRRQAASSVVRSATKPCTRAPSHAGSDRGSIRGPATISNRRSGRSRRASGYGVEHPAQQRGADPRATDTDDADRLVRAVAQPARAARPGRRGSRGRSRSRSRRSRSSARSSRGSPAGPAPKASGTTSSGLPTKTERSRSRWKRARCSIISALRSAVSDASSAPPSGIGSQPTKSVSQAYADRLSSGFSWRK